MVFREVNDAFLAMIGYSREEIIGRTSLELGIIRPCRPRAPGRRLQEQGSFRGTDLVLRARRGESLPTLYAIELMDFAGETWLLSSIIDITERKRAEAALASNEARLREAYQRLRLATDAANIGIWNWNFADDSLEWDDRMYELYAVPAEQRRAASHMISGVPASTPTTWRWQSLRRAILAVTAADWAARFRIVLPGGGVRYIESVPCRLRQQR